MRSRFSRGGFGRRGARRKEPVSWIRSASNAANAAGAGAALTLFTPNVLVTGAQDLRLTLRRLKVDILPVITAAPTNADSFLVWGIILVGITEGVPSPLFITAADQRADWLSHGIIGNNQYRQAAQTEAIAGTAKDMVIDVRAMRKVDADQAIVLTYDIFNPATGAIDATGRVQLNAFSSALFSRTMK